MCPCIPSGFVALRSLGPALLVLRVVQRALQSAPPLASWSPTCWNGDHFRSNRRVVHQFPDGDHKDVVWCDLEAAVFLWPSWTTPPPRWSRHGQIAAGFTTEPVPSPSASCTLRGSDSRRCLQGPVHPHRCHGVRLSPWLGRCRSVISLELQCWEIQRSSTKTTSYCSLRIHTFSRGAMRLVRRKWLFLQKQSSLPCSLINT